MTSVQRITIELPEGVVREIDQHHEDRGKFVAEAVERELGRRRQGEMLRSLENPHPESFELAEQGVADWAGQLPQEDALGLVEPGRGRAVEWVPERGWVGVDE